MLIATQVFLGSLLLLGCIVVHVVVLSQTIGALRQHAERHRGGSSDFVRVRLLAIALLAIIASHTIQIWMFAFSVMAMQALPDFETAIYFSLVTYTTLGYGDVTLGDAHRIFGAFGAVTGLLAFGLSTAFLVGLFGRMLPGQQQ